jgi:hypothetical protein
VRWLLITAAAFLTLAAILAMLEAVRRAFQTMPMNRGDGHE